MKAKSVCTVGKSIKVVFAVWILSFVLAVPTLIVQVLLVFTKYVDVFPVFIIITEMQHAFRNTFSNIKYVFLLAK